MYDKKRLVKSVVTGLLCGIFTSVALMCIFAAVMTKGGLLPAELLDYIMAGCLGAGALTGGFISAKINKGAGLIAGTAAGAAMLAALTLTSAIKGEADFSSLFFIKLAAAVLGGSLGGALAVREKKQKI